MRLSQIITITLVLGPLSLSRAPCVSLPGALLRSASGSGAGRGLSARAVCCMLCAVPPTNHHARKRSLSIKESFVFHRKHQSSWRQTQRSSVMSSHKTKNINTHSQNENKSTLVLQYLETNANEESCTISLGEQSL